MKREIDWDREERERKRGKEREVKGQELLWIMYEYEVKEGVREINRKTMRNKHKKNIEFERDRWQAERVSVCLNRENVWDKGS